jgi:tripartite-type tricarboxylate transporter receptor subunit TctC
MKILGHEDLGYERRHMTGSVARITRALLAAIAVAGAPGNARTDDYPARTIRAVVPFAPAGVMDLVARIVLERVGQSLGQQIVIDNRPGAGGTIAIDLVAHAPRDGYTIAIADPAGSLAASVSLYPKLNFDPVKDLTPIALLGTSGAVLSVSNALPAKTLPEFVALAKGRPGELMFGSAGNGTPGHLNGELFKRLTSIDVVHVPYRVGSQAVTDLIAGRISFWISPIATVLPQIQAGQLRPLAVSGRTRARELPDVPTVRESGFGDYDVSTSYALFAPAGTPQPILDRLEAEVKRALETESVNSRLRIAGVEPGLGPPEEVRRLLTMRIAQWSDVIKMSGIRIDER